MRRALTLLLLSGMLAACNTAKDRDEPREREQAERALPVIPDIY